MVLYRSGVLVQVPWPERSAIHKLSVADRRRAGPDRLKSPKDLLQASFPITALSADRPDELKDVDVTAPGLGPPWRTCIAASLVRLPKASAIPESLVKD